MRSSAPKENDTALSCLPFFGELTYLFQVTGSFFIILCKRSSLFQILQICFSFHVSIWIHVYCFRFETLEPKLYSPEDSKPQPSANQSSSLSRVLPWDGWKCPVFFGRLKDLFHVTGFEYCFYFGRFHVSSEIMFLFHVSGLCA